MNDYVDPKGPLAISSLDESQAIIAFMLYKQQIPWDLAIIHSGESICYANKMQDNSTSIKRIHGIKELLSKLKKKNIILGVLTADKTTKAWKHLQNVQLADYFDFVIGSDQVENGKPYPDMAYLARDRYGITLSKTMIIGDTNADMQLGKRAGMNATVGIVTYSKNAIDHLKDANFIIKNYSEVIN